MQENNYNAPTGEGESNMKKLITITGVMLAVALALVAATGCTKTVVFGTVEVVMREDNNDGWVLRLAIEKETLSLGACNDNGDIKIPSVCLTTETTLVIFKKQYITVDSTWCKWVVVDGDKVTIYINDDAYFDVPIKYYKAA